MNVYAVYKCTVAFKPCLIPLLLDVVCVSFSQANYTVLESGGVAEIVVQADRDFSFTFEVEVQLMPDTAQCKHLACTFGYCYLWLVNSCIKFTLPMKLFFQQYWVWPDSLLMQ